MALLLQGDHPGPFKSWIPGLWAQPLIREQVFSGRKASAIQEDPDLGTVHVKGVFLRARCLLWREMVSYRGLASAASRESKMAFPFSESTCLLRPGKLYETPHLCILWGNWTYSSCGYPCQGMRALLFIRMLCRKESGPDCWRRSTDSLLEFFFFFFLRFLPKWTPEKNMSPGWAALGPFLRVLATVPWALRAWLVRWHGRRGTCGRTLSERPSSPWHGGDSLFQVLSPQDAVLPSLRWAVGFPIWEMRTEEGEPWWHESWWTKRITTKSEIDMLKYTVSWVFLSLSSDHGTE